MKNAFPHQFISKAFVHLANMAKRNLLEAELHGLILDVDPHRGLITFVNVGKLKVKILLSRAAKAKDKLRNSSRHIKVVFSSINSGTKKERVIPFMETYKLTLDKNNQGFWLAPDGYHFHPLTLISKILMWLQEYVPVPA